ncbi:MAG TPA: DUF6249 domain-containing protein [Spirochaetia bacterium]|nr:DUF6249 domain-containing protein [Spirochaetia bacterium]
MNSVPSAAAQIMVTVIPIVGIVMGCVVVFFYLLWRHKQRMLMIEKGMSPYQPFDISTFSLLAGLLNLIVGAVLSIFFLLKSGASYSLLGGLIPFSIGLSLIIFYRARQSRA